MGLIVIWLVVEPTPLKNMSSSIGMMTYPIYGKIKHVPNHQPDFNSWYLGCNIFLNEWQTSINEKLVNLYWWIYHHIERDSLFFLYTVKFTVNCENCENDSDVTFKKILKKKPGSFWKREGTSLFSCFGDLFYDPSWKMAMGLVGKHLLVVRSSLGKSWGSKSWNTRFTIK